MIDLIQLREFSKGNIIEAQPLPNPTERQYFQRGQDMSLLIFTEAGNQLIERARQTVRSVFENVKPAPRNTRPKEEHEKWSTEIENMTNNALVGGAEWTNTCDDVFLAQSDDEFRQGLAKTEKQQKSLDTLHELFKTYGMALDYQSRQGGNDQLRLPGLVEPNDRLLQIIDETNLSRIRDAFRLGWNSVVSNQNL